MMNIIAATARGGSLLIVLCRDTTRDEPYSNSHVQGISEEG